MQLINTIGTSWKMSIKEEKKLIMLRIYDHHLIKNNQFFFFSESSRELYANNKSNEKLTFSPIMTLFSG